MIQILQDLKMPGSEAEVIIVPRHDDVNVQLSLFLEMPGSNEGVPQILTTQMNAHV
ncbi:hypothetical protein SAMN04489725_11012 [Alicyclobacillus hesperidum]|uniref:Uncharacterized protein n=1 Tax=Alicyclobacillus hesperidum TaxID=89784 RepID=A0A1H2V6B5_9BACL|nr:hypothetical protein SAMN04489725_11012 [Alicyclobacillus hesperidum]